MCFRPSPVKQESTDMNTCQTCGMPVAADMDVCPYCGDPIPPNPPNDFNEADPSKDARIL